LRDANFLREGGRSCQCDKKFIDWCGCSPNYYKRDDLKRLKVLYFLHGFIIRFSLIVETKQSLRITSIFLARKFDPIRNQQIINKWDDYLFKIKGSFLLL
jgi:hypothetical protein